MAPIKHIRLKKPVLLGILVSAGILLICVVGLAIYAVNSDKKMDQLKTTYDEEIRKLERQLTIQEQNYVKTYALARDVRAGEKITADDVKEIHIARDAVPDNTITPDEAVGKILKIDLLKNSILTTDMVYSQGELDDDLRLHEYTVINLPSKLEKRDYVDVRISFPTGEDYIVLSKKRVEDLENGRVWHVVNEKEILLMSSAIVDAYIHDGILYAVEYVEPEMQKAAAVTYPPNPQVLRLVQIDPNIVKKAITGLEKRMREQLEESLATSPHHVPKQKGIAPTPFEPRRYDEKQTPTGGTATNVDTSPNSSNSDTTTGGGGNAGSPITDSSSQGTQAIDNLKDNIREQEAILNN